MNNNKIILFGAGYWGVNYIRELAGNLVCVVEPDEERAQYVNESYNVEVFPELPNHVKFDSAIICTPPMSHVEIALDVLKQGHNVLIEKPFAMNVMDALKLRKYADQIMVGHIFLHHPEVIKLKEEIIPNLALNHAYSRRTNDGPVRPWQDSMWDLAIHDVSIMNYFFGAPFEMESLSASNHWSVIRLEYPTINAIIYVSWLGSPKVRKLELVPQTGGERIVYDDMKIVLEISPLRRMLDDFMTGAWDEKCSYHAGLEVINVLEKCSQRGVADYAH